MLESGCSKQKGNRDNEKQVGVDNMALANDSPSSYLYRIQWKAIVFQWLEERMQYNDFNLDNCLTILEDSPVNRAAALASFWGVYLADELPPVITDLQQDRIEKLLYNGSPKDLLPEDIKNIAYVKLHLAGLLIICLIRPDWPIIENPSAVTALEKALEAYLLAVEPGATDSIIDDPSAWGTKYFDDDLFTFSLVMVGGIACVELSFWRTEQRNYEEAFWDITNGAWNICAARIESKLDGLPSFKPYLPHSGNQFNIQEAADIFEEVKKHSRDIKNWEYIQMGCEAIQHLGYYELYDFLDSIKDANGDIFGAVEYWGRGSTFAEDQLRLVASPVPIVTRDMIERIDIRERLKRDFLQTYWEEIDSNTQEILLDAEMEWVHNRPGNMACDIRPMLERVLLSVFPFLKSTLTQRDNHMVLTRIRDYLQTKPVVQALIDGLPIDSRDKAWAKDDLPKFLQKVLDTRNYFEKEQHLLDRKSRKYLEMMETAISIHRELLGIGCEGMLPRLMRIKRSINL
jgi:hypothetical protein